MFNVQSSMFNVQSLNLSIFNVQCSIFNVQCSISQSLNLSISQSLNFLNNVLLAAKLQFFSEIFAYSSK